MPRPSTTLRHRAWRLELLDYSLKENENWADVKGLTSECTKNKYRYTINFIHSKIPQQIKLKTMKQSMYCCVLILLFTKAQAQNVTITPDGITPVLTHPRIS